MDGDPAVESELDSFSRTLPLPFRVALLVVLGVWAWGVNLHGLSLFGIDVPQLIQYPRRASLRANTPYHLSTYRLASVLTIPLFLFLVLFWAFSHRDTDLVIAYDYVPIWFLVILLGYILSPISLPGHSNTGRLHFLRALKRVSIGGIAQGGEGKFGDILLADVLTSYAKVIADLFVSFCMFFTRDAATSRPDRACGGEYLVPILIAIPSAIRFRQCITEYRRVRVSNRQSGGTGAHGWGGQHLANALKYSSAFPVVIFSALQRKMSLNHDSVGMTETTLYRLWLLAVMVNSLYSFYWDVTKDWDLTLFTPSSSFRSSYPLRPSTRLYFRGRSVYYAAIFIDFLLRITWALKLSPHLDHFADFESGIFIMEALEVGRRWMWIFLRVETEWARDQNKTDLGHPDQTDVLMGDYRRKDSDSDEDY